MRGPSDVVQNILGTISPNYTPDDPTSATLACAKAHNLAFKIGGKVRGSPSRNPYLSSAYALQMFPIDPRDLPGPVSAHDAQNCVIDNLVATDAPGVGALFRWSLGDPFMKSYVALFSHPISSNVNPLIAGILSLSTTET